MNARRTIPMVLLIVAILAPTSALAEGGPYGKGITLKLIEISPDRSLPIVSSPGDYIEGAHMHVREIAASRLKMMRSELKNIGGWMAFRAPAGRNKTIDERGIDFVTNDPDTLRRDARKMFSALGCFPSNPLGYRAILIDTVGVAIFDNLVFVHNTFLGIVVLQRDPTSGMYRYLGRPVTSNLPLGEVKEYVLGERPAYVFVQNTEWRDMEAWYPTRLQVIVFDDSGKPVLGGGRSKLRADSVEAEGKRLVLERSTVALVASPLPGNSALFCPHAKNAQYSLLDPLTRKPVAFKSRLTLEYLGGYLQPTGLHLLLAHPGGDPPQFGGVACRSFRTLAEIRKETDFGLGHWNDDHTKWISGGTAEGYIKGSWESSALFWSRLATLLRKPSLIQIDVAPELQGKLQSFWQACQGCPLGTYAPPGLGDDQAFSFLKLALAPEKAKKTP